MTILTKSQGFRKVDSTSKSDFDVKEVKQKPPLSEGFLSLGD